MGAFTKLTKAAVLKLLKKKRPQLQAIDDLAKGRNLERSAIRNDPAYRASQGTDRGLSGSQAMEALGFSSKPRSGPSVFGDAGRKKLLASRGALRQEVTGLVKQLRSLGGKTKDYKKPGMQKEINKMNRQKQRWNRSYGWKGPR